ncbi:MAG: di-trans,poly-cis-decaprenylcistransferase [Anaerolineales bacterium]|nr:di-trans,poly-cis-decaprenylcistransferase [Anaerolineales bacterium]MCB0008823.1 di-trans,poly-cis-decaprenylcistransferase [Anaerolineales bacterium]MCB8961794.1 di-trans,poly-cis-decaprenylcistransferase [Ardenticatenales bacterium]
MLPRHIAFIMDGNGRWATAQGLPRSAGHKAGYEHIPKVLQICQELGVKVVSGYAWSTENWGRPKAEVNFILKAMEKQLPRFVNELHKRNVRFLHSGFVEDLSPKARQQLAAAVALTQNNDAGTFNLAYNYGARAEILRAARQLLHKQTPAEELSLHDIEVNLFTAGLPEVDLVIRSGGDKRLSNFLLWQSAHALVHVVPNYWPAISRADIEGALTHYARAMAPA